MLGRLNPVKGGWISGWAGDGGADEQSRVELIIDGEVVGAADCDRPRAAGRSGGGAFRWRIPERYLDGEAHVIRARLEGSEIELAASPRAAILGDPVDPVARPLAPFARDTVLEVEGSFDALAARLRSGGRLAILAAHQTTLQPPRYLRHYLESLRSLGCAIVVVNAAAERVSKRRRKEIPRCDFEGLADVVVWRRNLGWDFASWIVALDRLQAALPTVDALLLVNDSVFGPLFDLGAAIDRMDDDGCDFWGITDSWEIQYHLQSYFQLFKPKVLRTEAFARFLATYPMPLARQGVIRHGEAGLTTALVEGGLRPGVLCPYQKVSAAWLKTLPERLASVRELPEALVPDVAYMAGSHGPWEHHGHTLVRHWLWVAGNARMGTPLNPTHYFWDTLITDFSCPFLKRDLLLKNPVAIPSVADVERVIGACTEYPYDDIVEAARLLPGARCPVMPAMIPAAVAARHGAESGVAAAPALANRRARFWKA